MADAVFAGFRADLDSDQFQAGGARLVEKTAEHGAHVPGLELQTKHVSPLSSAMPQGRDFRPTMRGDRHLRHLATFPDGAA